jgi:hypothetical protein
VANGAAKVTFAISGGTVDLFPLEGAGERLVNFLLDNPRIVRTL